jgi:hypothetical protein
MVWLGTTRFGNYAVAEIEKPMPDLVKMAARALKKPETASKRTIQRMAARILDDQKNDPEPHKPSPKKRK